MDIKRKIIIVRRSAETKPCKICKKHYKPPNSQSLFCSPDCKRLGRNERLRKRSAEKREGIIYTCTGCSKEFTPTKLYNNTHNYCSRECKSKYYYYLSKNKDRMSTESGKLPGIQPSTADRMREFINDLKRKSGGCHNCGEDNIDLLEFAHYDMREKEITIATCQSKSRILNELPKGRWLCVWCHRLETADELFHTQDTQRRKGINYINKIKLDIGKCSLCEMQVTSGNTFCFEFDHIIQGEKKETIADLVACSKDRINREIAKCRLLCCKCHRTYTIKQARENRERKKLLDQLPKDY